MNIQYKIKKLFCSLNAKGRSWAGFLGILAVAIAFIGVLVQCCQNSSRPENAVEYNIGHSVAFNKCVFQINVPDTKDDNVCAILSKEGKCAISSDGVDEYLLAGLYYWGVGVNADRAKAFRLVRNAAYKNNPDALFELGVYYYQGIGTNRNLIRSFDCFNRSAELGCLRAETALGCIYQFGLGFPVQTDAEQGFEHFMRAAKREFPLAYVCVAFCYSVGYGSEMDNVQAKVWAEKGLKSDDAKIVGMAEQVMNILGK